MPVTPDWLAIPGRAMKSKAALNINEFALCHSVALGLLPRCGDLRGTFNLFLFSFSNKNKTIHNASPQTLLYEHLSRASARLASSRDSPECFTMAAMVIIALYSLLPSRRSAL